MELNTYFDKITGLMGRVKGREANRASEAGEDREEIGSMLELTGLNRRAFSFVRSLDKMEPEKRDDVLRSFDSLRDMLDPHWDGQSTPDMLDGKAPVEEATSSSDEREPETAEASDGADESPDVDPETEEFNAAVDETMDERVVPINFGGGAELRVVAIDAATQCGIAVGDTHGKPVAWSVDLGAGKSEDVRFSNALRLTHDLIEQHQPDLIAIEAFIGGKHASAFLIGLVACMRGCAANRGVKCIMVFPATARKHLIGKALTSRDFPHLKPAKAKIAIKQQVKQRCEAMGWTVPDHDSADALAVLDWALANHAPRYQAAPHGELFNG